MFVYFASYGYLQYVDIDIIINNINRRFRRFLSSLARETVGREAIARALESEKETQRELQESDDGEFMLFNIRPKLTVYWWEFMISKF